MSLVLDCFKYRAVCRSNVSWMLSWTAKGRGTGAGRTRRRSVPLSSKTGQRDGSWQAYHRQTGQRQSVVRYGTARRMDTRRCNATRRAHVLDARHRARRCLSCLEETWWVSPAAVKLIIALHSWQPVSSDFLPSYPRPPPSRRRLHHTAVVVVFFYTSSLSYLLLISPFVSLMLNSTFGREHMCVVVILPRTASLLVYRLERYLQRAAAVDHPWVVGCFIVPPRAGWSLVEDDDLLQDCRRLILIQLKSNLFNGMFYGIIICNKLHVFNRKIRLSLWYDKIGKINTITLRTIERLNTDFKFTV